MSLFNTLAQTKLDDLKVLDIIPRTPSPVPLCERNPKDLNNAQLQEVVLEQRKVTLIDILFFLTAVNKYSVAEIDDQTGAYFTGQKAAM
jgi:hypothetical protein